MENEVDRTGVVHDIEPVSHILALTVDRQRLTVTDIVDKQRNKLLRELVRAIVVRAVRHYRGHAESVVESAYEMVRRSLGSAVGAVRLILGLLREKLGFVHGERAVNLVGGDMVETLSFPVAVPCSLGGLE